MFSLVKEVGDVMSLGREDVPYPNILIKCFDASVKLSRKNKQGLTLKKVC